jgi:hypothetical protein
VVAFVRELCAWIGLAWGALSFPTTAPGEAANVVVAGDFAYATRGSEGIEIVRLSSGARRALPLAAGESADDLAVADGLLFVLDARPPGALSIYSLADPEAPELRQAPVAVEVGPFSGVSAAAGRVVVSGGTGLLSLRAYAPDGSLGADAATADLGRGQPDVLVAPDARAAYVSTHLSGPRFALTVAELGSAPLRVVPRGSVPLATFGFTPGGARPASFPIESALAGRVLFVAHAAGLAAIEVADPAAPRLLGVLRLEVEPVAVDVLGATAALVGSQPEPRLALVDVRDPAHPEVVRSVALPAGSRPTGVAIAPSHLVVAAHGAGLLVLDRDSLAPRGDRSSSSKRPSRTGSTTWSSGRPRRSPRRSSPAGRSSSRSPWRERCSRRAASSSRCPMPRARRKRMSWEASPRASWRSSSSTATSTPTASRTPRRASATSIPTARPTSSISTTTRTG